jgi:hypothetical protein
MNWAVRFNLAAAAFSVVAAFAVPPVTPHFLWYALGNFALAMLIWGDD